MFARRSLPCSDLFHEPRTRTRRVPGPALTFAIAIAAAGCSGGAAEREDDVTPFTGSNTPYVPAMPQQQTPNDQTAAQQNDGDGQTPNGNQDGSENNDDDELPLTPAGDGSSTLGAATLGGSGSSSDRYFKTAVTRNGQNYFFMANGWGPGWDSHVVSWEGTSFTVESLLGEQGPQYQPASFPTVFCGVYSDAVSGACGLPAALDAINSLSTGWSWQPNGNTGEYNASYDIWMGTGTTRNTHSGYLMVWFREPVGQQPAGSRTLTNVTVQNVPGTWDIWTGFVGPLPIINWVRAEGADTLAMEFDVMDFVHDAQQRGLPIPGTHILSVATGFEIWQGPVTNLESVDFYVDVQ